MIRPIKKKDELNFIYFCKLEDKYQDFYITKENQRYFLTDDNIAKEVFNRCYKESDICYISEEGNTINGILLIIGYAEKANRKYVKILAENQKIADNLLKDIFAKLNNKNTLIHTFKDNGYRFLGGRGSQTLLIRSRDGFNTQNNKKSSGRSVAEGRV